VVAQEVRNLAPRSKDAARRTETLIGESVDLASRGDALTRAAGARLTGVAGAAAEMATLLADIAHAEDEQRRGIDRVNRAVAQMDRVTQQNSASSEESASAAEELARRAVELSEQVGSFRLEGAAARGRLALGAR
jgi:methyl-accepting chemotaxis protein